MNKLNLKAGMVVLAMSISVSGWAALPCMPIAKACMQAGFYKGGESTGKGLIKDCVMPVVAKTKVLPNTSFGDDELQKCQLDLAAKMKAQQGKGQ